MINRLVDYALNNRFLILSGAILLFAWGGLSFHQLPVEAYPDVANNYVQVITQWPGRAAEEVEQQVTIPLEIGMNGIPHMVHLRSVSLAGLSSLMMVFDDESENDWNREKVLERLQQVTLPQGLTPQIGTDWSPVGQVYFFTLKSTNPKYDVMELKSLEDWTVEKSFKQVPDIVDVASFGGPTREYQVRLDPNALVAHGLSIAQVEQQLTNNNANAGGSFIETGLQQVNVREVGLVDRVRDIADTVITTKNGTPLRMRDIAVVEQGPKVRLGQFGRATHKSDGRIIDNPDVVSGIVLLRKGADPDEALQGVHAKVEELNGDATHPGILPPGVKVVPFLDRSDLVHLTTHTVLENLGVGMALVVVILLLFLGNVRGAIIVSLTIPFSLLFAATCLKLKGIPANLLSLGALDFGMVVDGAVVMVENIIRHQNARGDDRRPVMTRIFQAAHEVQRPVFYAIGIIITAYLPIFTLERVEGRLFKPMAWTVAFALLGALVFSMLIAPVLASLFFPRGTKEWHNPVMEWLTAQYRHAVKWAIEHRWAPIFFSACGVGVAMYLTLFVIGSEFLPHLDEGALWVRGTLAPSTGPTEGTRLANQARIILASFPEVTQTTSQVGRPDDGTDTTGFFNTEYFVDLKPKEQWRPIFHQDKEELIQAMSREVSKLPGVVWGFSQPIADNMEEAVSGVKGELAVKIYGTELRVLEDKADAVTGVMRKISGIEDLGVFRVLGQPNLNFQVDRQAAARYQINAADVQDAIQAVGGNALTQVLQGEARYDLVMRYLPDFRDRREALENIRLLAPSGERVSLAQLCKVQAQDGASEIYREGNSRYVAVKFSVRGRDLGGAVEEAIAKVAKGVQLPEGYHIAWEGEYASQQRAQARLFMIVPLTVLLIAIILYTMFKSFKWAGLILVNILIAPVGGVVALFLTGTNFSVSSGVGFLALFGVSVQVGVILLEYINQLRARGDSVEDSAIEGAVLRLRPIMMTMLVATLGLLPAAMSHGIGSDSQRPFAIVIVGGLMAALVMSIFLLPTLYVWVAGDHDILPKPEAGDEV